MNKCSSALPLRNTFPADRLAILLGIGLALILSALLSGISAQDEPDSVLNNADSHDKLAYVSQEDRLMLYDPRDGTETTLLDSVQRFLLSRQGRVAFTRTDENDTDLYAFDPSTPALAPINLTQNPAVRHYPLAWSPDGRYLAFVSYQDEDDRSLYVWDGKTVTNVMPDDALDTADSFYVDWSYDGRLAFTVGHPWRISNQTPSEIYVWDGSTTTSLSQNPEGWDGAVSWSSDGQLMFGSTRDKEDSGIYVWDGMAFKNGYPDTDTFIRLAPELKPSSATWMDDGLVAFTGYADSSPSGMKEIVLWDLEREVIVERYPVTSDNYFSRLAEGGQMILSTHLASGISFYLDIENTEGQILFSTQIGYEYSWSLDGYLAYCRLDEDGIWVLSLWDGEETRDVARNSPKPVRWQNGRETFSCNNG